MLSEHASVQLPWRIYAHGSLEVADRLHGRIASEIVDAVARLRGAKAARRLHSRGITMLHECIEPADVAFVRDHVLDSLRTELLQLAVAVGRALLDWNDEFYVDDYLILRINFPYEIARSADHTAENPGIGRLSRHVRETANSRRVRDPVYDPQVYHRGKPPAAWAHGPHVDSWTGHSKDGTNVWWAIGDVPADAGMVLYPGCDAGAVARDPATLYVRHGFPLPPPTRVALAAGEMLLFDPEILHGTHLNVAEVTRIAISLRLNARKPQFDAHCFYAREFWRSSLDIEAGRLDAVLHLKREENFAPAEVVASCPSPVPLRVVEARASNVGGRFSVGPLSLIDEGERIIVVLSDRRVMLARVKGKIFAVDAICPHYGLNLADGGMLDDTVYCPGCAVGFNIETGRSALATLALRTYQVSEVDGTIIIDPATS